MIVEYSDFSLKIKAEVNYTHMTEQRLSIYDCLCANDGSIQPSSIQFTSHNNPEGNSQTLNTPAMTLKLSGQTQLLF